jgi:hypothetical protein
MTTVVETAADPGVAHRGRCGSAAVRIVNDEYGHEAVAGYPTLGYRGPRRSRHVKVSSS